MQYKVFACDLDETLLGSDHLISQKNLTAIQKARETYGLRLVPCTGRGYLTTQRELKLLGLYDSEGEYVLSYNGGCLTENKNNKRLFFKSVRYETACKIADLAKDYDVGIQFYTIDMIYVYRLNEDERRRKEGQKAVFTEIFSLDISFLKEIPIAKVLLQKADMPYLKALKPLLLPIVGDDCEITFSSGRFMEITAAGIDKGFGLKLLSDLLSIPLSEMIAAGDNLNDIPMLEAAGLAVCPANAVEEVKAVCDYVAKADNDQDAIAEILEHYHFTE